VCLTCCSDRESNLHSRRPRFTGRTGGSPQGPSHPHLILIIARDVRKGPVRSFGRPSAYRQCRPVPPVPVSSGAKSRP
jgi:hypothetical protein